MGLGRSLVADELGLVNERIVSKRVVGGDRVALGITIRRALKHGTIVCHELAAGLVLEVIHEDTLQSRAQRNGDDHADGAHECRTNNEGRQAHDGMHLDRALHDLRRNDVVGDILCHHGHDQGP